MEFAIAVFYFARFDFCISFVLKMVPRFMKKTDLADGHYWLHFLGAMKEIS